MRSANCATFVAKLCFSTENSVILCKYILDDLFQLKTEHLVKPYIYADT